MRHFITFALGSLCISAVACTSVSTEDVGTANQAQITDVRSMTQRPDGKFDVICNDGRIQIVAAADLLANRVCLPAGPVSSTIIYGRSDSCEASAVAARVTADTDCNALGEDAAWSVKDTRGTCNNISDTTVSRACHGLGISTQSLPVIYGRSDSCEGSAFVTRLTADFDCGTLSSSDAAWSVKRADGTCDNISDTTVERACRGLLPASRSAPIIYGRSDSCEGSALVARITADTDCNALSDSDVAWSVKTSEGICQNISDTTVSRACHAIAPTNPSMPVIYGRSDSCEGSAIVARILPDTDCNTLSDDAAWSVRNADGSCSNISDTTVSRACFALR